MSFIHDALRRSQQQRDQARELTVESVHASHDGIAPQPGSRLVYALLVTAILTAGAVWLLSGRGLSERGDTVPGKTTAGIRADNGAVSAAPGQIDRGIPAPGPVVAPSQQPVSLSGPPVQPVYPDLPFAWELQEPLRQRLASVAVTIHVYAPGPTNRVLFLNDREYRQGDRMADGVEVVEIVPEGAVLRVGEVFFRLPRPR